MILLPLSHSLGGDKLREPARGARSAPGNPFATSTKGSRVALDADVLYKWSVKIENKKFFRGVWPCQ